MWRKLCSIYEQTSETTIHIVQQRFFNYKYEDGTDMSTFLSKIEELKNQLKQMGENISERFVITKVLMSLPVKYQHFISAWESASEDKQTYDNLVARLLIEEERLKDKEEVPQQSAAFVAKKIERKNIKCFKCQKVGHLQSECRSGQYNNENRNTHRSDTREKPWKKCYYCKKSGHTKKLKTNLFSVTCVTAKGYVMKIDNEKCKIYKQTKLCAVGERSGDMYYMNFRYKCVEANIAQVQQIFKVWHERLAHQNGDNVKGYRKFLEQKKEQTEQFIMLDNDEVGEDKVSSEEKINEIIKQSSKSVEQKKVRQNEEDRVLSPRRNTRVRKTSFYKCNCVSTQENEPNRIRDAMKRQKENDAEITKIRIKKCDGNVKYKVRRKIRMKELFD
uniref:CCHC-type domain-containing protein n=1 Tax=Heliothis virescens TaxID=7102 RepID=A0A2A4J621_HELVI